MTRRLAEVAKKVGVSEATVSRVLNGREGVSKTTRSAVLTALDVLGYERPSKLRAERGRLVGLLMPELENPIFPALAEAVSRSLVQLECIPMLCVRGATGLSEPAYIDLLLGQQVAGLILVCGNYSGLNAPSQHYQSLLDRALPVMLINAGRSDLRFSRVCTDDAVAVEQAYAHLASLGHQRIGLILGPEDHVPSRRKLASYLAIVNRQVSGSPGPEVEHGAFSLEAGHATATRLVQRGVTGIVCASDPLALGAVRAVRRLGLRVPEDVSVVGFDDSPFMMCTDPPLTTIRQPIEALGRAAATLLVSQIEGTPGEPEELLFEPELVVRGSTAPRRLAAAGRGQVPGVVHAGPVEALTPG